MSTLKVAKGTTILMSLGDVEQYNVETAAYANIATPDTVGFAITNPAGTNSTYAGNQVGTTNSWNASHTVDTTGDWVWKATVVKGSYTLITEPERIIVVASTRSSD